MTCDKILEVDKSNTDALLKKGKIYISGNKEKEFFEVMEEVIAIDPKNAQAYVMQAEFCASKNEFKKAATYTDKVVELCPDNPSVHYFSGFINYNIHNFQQCFDDMKSALDLGSKSMKYINILVYAA